MSLNCLFLTVFLFISPCLFAQQLDSNLINQQFVDRYKENGELSYTSPLSEIGAPSKYIISGKLTTTYMLLGTKNSPIAFAVIPEFTVRVRNEQSAGVRTPSFKLGGSTFIRLNKNINNYKYAELSFTHHSNGQDGEAVNANSTINTYNGNFSTNYLTTSYRFGSFSNKNQDEDYSSNNHRIGLQWNKWFAYEKALDNNYGFTRLLYNFSWRRYAFYFSEKKNGWKRKANDEPKAQKLEKEYLRFNTEISYAVNKIQNYGLIAPKKRLNAELSIHYSLPFMNNVFLMAAAGYYGEDPYNIYFNDKYAYTRFGISTGFIKYNIN
ncbi:hypothetical protein [Pedobacter cryophilus]|uniref:Phosphatidylcholine 1-acylhydrolase n=1 Tax=Pedobacter cryophilus TaxID=2571271 RepID=A0A4U1BXZ0_9SPHI|nr:hypothetical protein [Pedobacter cryophilus]TKB97866.1 hypothetical protein FA046_10980 [Pedobacter cryophilus]